MRTNEQVVRDANELARKFYSMNGCKVKKGFNFESSCHPQERLMWDMAVKAYEVIDGTDVDDALADIEDA